MKATPEQIAAELRLLAEAIEAKKAIVILNASGQVAAHDDFTLHRMILTWSQKKP